MPFIKPDSGLSSIARIDFLLENDRPSESNCGRPILIGRLDGLLGAWLRVVGIEEQPGVGWGLRWRPGPSSPVLSMVFRGTLGRRMCRYMHYAVKTDWQWSPPDEASWCPHFGCAFATIDNLWFSGGIDGPEYSRAMDLHESREDWDMDFRVLPGNSGFVAIDHPWIDRASPRAPEDATTVMVRRVLRHPAIWKVIRHPDREYNIRLDGSLDEFLDADRSLEVSWETERIIHLSMVVAMPDRGRHRNLSVSVHGVRRPMTAHVRSMPQAKKDHDERHLQA